MASEEAITKYCMQLDADAKAASIAYALDKQNSKDPQIIAGLAFIAGVAWVIERLPQITDAVKRLTDTDD